MPARFHYRNLMLRTCFQLITMNVFQWSNVSKSELKCSGHCFPVAESKNLFFSFDFVIFLLKTNMGRQKD